MRIPRRVTAALLTAATAYCSLRQRLLFKRAEERLVRMSEEDATNLLNVFRGSYGRLCHLTCKALHDGAPSELVQEAFTGGGSFGTPVLNAIRTRYVETNAALREASKYYASPALTLAAVEVRKAHESEWCVKIPAVAAA